jgi:hypothetical protein
MVIASGREQGELSRVKASSPGAPMPAQVLPQLAESIIVRVEIDHASVACV